MYLLLSTISQGSFKKKTISQGQQIYLYYLRKEK